MIKKGRAVNVEIEEDLYIRLRKHITANKGLWVKTFVSEAIREKLNKIKVR